jgi:hypothetical protein
MSFDEAVRIINDLLAVEQQSGSANGLDDLKARRVRRASIKQQLQGLENIIKILQEKVNFTCITDDDHSSVGVDRSCDAQSGLP